jgi:hypothetical protein
VSPAKVRILFTPFFGSFSKDSGVISVYAVCAFYR